MNQRNKGFLIVLEGIQGTGKTTIKKYIQKYFEEKGIDVVDTEWNSNPLIKPLMDSMKNSQYFTPRLYCLLHATEFASRYDKIIEKTLNNGGVVVCDRYKYTALTRDVSRGLDSSYVNHVYSFATEPDVIFYIDLPVEIALERKLKTVTEKKAKGTAYYGTGMDVTKLPMKESFIEFQGELRKEYIKLFKGKENVVILDGIQNIDNVCNAVENTLNQYFNNNSLI